MTNGYLWPFVTSIFFVWWETKGHEKMCQLEEKRKNKMKENTQSVNSTISNFFGSRWGLKVHLNLFGGSRLSLSTLAFEGLRLQATNSSTLTVHLVHIGNCNSLSLSLSLSHTDIQIHILWRRHFVRVCLSAKLSSSEEVKAIVVEIWSSGRKAKVAAAVFLSLSWCSRWCSRWCCSTRNVTAKSVHWITFQNSKISHVLCRCVSV